MTRRLSGRTREALAVIYRLGEASAADIQREVPDVPSYSAARSILRSLESRGLVHHEERGPRYVYVPTVSKVEAARRAVAELVDTFFEGSPTSAIQTLLEVSHERDFDVDTVELERLIDQAAREGR